MSIKVVDPNEVLSNLNYQDLYSYASVQILSKINNGIYIDLNGTNDQYFDTLWSSDTKDIRKQKNSFIGVKKISITLDASFIPKGNIVFYDIRNTNFSDIENSSLYNIYDFPPPIFRVILKGVYGNGIIYDMHMTDYKTSFNAEVGSMEISCDLVGLTFAPLTNILFQYVLNFPKMDTNTESTEEIRHFYQLVNKLKNNYGNIPQKIDESSTIKKYNELNKRINTLKDIKQNLITPNFYTEDENEIKIGYYDNKTNEYIENKSRSKYFYIKTNNYLEFINRYKAQSSLEIFIKPIILNLVGLGLLSNENYLEDIFDKGNKYFVQRIDVEYLISIINDDIDKSKKEFKKIESKTKDEVEKIVIEEINFKPTIKNLFDLLLDDVEIVFNKIREIDSDGNSNIFPDVYNTATLTKMIGNTVNKDIQFIQKFIETYHRTNRENNYSDLLNEDGGIKVLYPFEHKSIYNNTQTIINNISDIYEYIEININTFINEVYWHNLFWGDNVSFNVNLSTIKTKNEKNNFVKFENLIETISNLINNEDLINNIIAQLKSNNNLLGNVNIDINSDYNNAESNFKIVYDVNYDEYTNKGGYYLTSEGLPLKILNSIENEITEDWYNNIYNVLNILDGNNVDYNLKKVYIKYKILGLYSVNLFTLDRYCIAYINKSRICFYGFMVKEKDNLTQLNENIGEIESINDALQNFNRYYINNDIFSKDREFFVKYYEDFGEEIYDSILNFFDSSQTLQPYNDFEGYINSLNPFIDLNEPVYLLINNPTALRIKGNDINKNEFSNVNKYNDRNVEVKDAIKKRLSDLNNELINSLKNKLEQITKDTVELNKLKYNRHLINENYHAIKTIYDRWIKYTNGVGYPYIGNKKLKDVFVYVDRAMKNIENTIVDPEIILDMIDDPNLSVYSVISTILSDNGFEFFPLQNFIKDPKMFDNTFKIGQKEITPTEPYFVCMYIGGGTKNLKLESENIDFNKNVNLDYYSNKENNYGNSEFPENSINVFRVLYGSQGQSMFSGYSIESAEKRPTNESIQIMSRIANDDNKSAASIVPNNLYSMYQERAYNAKISGLGNVMIQPTQFFNLENIPLYSGGYLIISTEHDMSDNLLKTSFTGTKMNKFPLPAVNEINTLFGIDLGYDDIFVDNETIPNNTSEVWRKNELNYIDYYTLKI